MCSSPYHLAHTSDYSHRAGTSVNFQRVSDTSSYRANFFEVFGLQFLLAAILVCGAVAVGGLWRVLRKPR